MENEFLVRGIDDKRRLLKFFAAKDHKNLVLRIADVLDMIQEDQNYVMNLVSLFKDMDPWYGDKNRRKAFFLKNYPDGYIRLPIDAILDPMELPDIEKLQAILYAYVEIRRGKGEPQEVEVCKECRGFGFVTEGRKRTCKACMGEGKIIIFTEMSKREIKLAEQEV